MCLKIAFVPDCQKWSPEYYDLDLICQVLDLSKIPHPGGKRFADFLLCRFDTNLTKYVQVFISKNLKNKNRLSRQRRRRRR